MHTLEEHYEQMKMDEAPKHLSINANSTENLRGMLRKLYKFIRYSTS